MKALDAKVVILGKEGVGKTSIVVRYVGKIFSSQVSPTMGASFFTFKMNVDNHRVKLSVWDTAGQERFKSMAPMYYRKSNAAFLVYDITDSNTFQDIKIWAEELEKNIDGPIVICVLGNKSDLDSRRQVTSEDGLKYAASIGALFFETSALNDEGVSEAFLRVALALISLASSASSSGMMLRDYDPSRKQSLDITALPTHLNHMRDSTIPEEGEDGHEGTPGGCCS